ncbi:hypothetical protein C8Q79DRAFT_977495 [Trametes meyenii]|nr:hypothetical protein C8Q79DRAFT_977495 [Trametes meyenii]
MGGGRVMPATPQEVADIEMLSSMMGGSLDHAHALRLLRKHQNNLEKAASALLEGDNGEDAGAFADLPALEPLDTATVGPRTPPPSRPEKPVIDLTKDDDDGELARALQASLEDQPTTFGPSDRAPDPNWAMVSSNTAVGAPSGMSQDEEAMSRAIEASLSHTIGEDIYEELPLEERIRKGDTPVALRPTSSGLTYAALILHGIFFIPQVRNAVATWLPKPPSDDEMDDDDEEDEEDERVEEDETTTESGPRMSGLTRQMWSIMELFTNMDLARMSELSVDAVMEAFNVKKWSSPAERPGDMSSNFYRSVTYVVEQALEADNLNNVEGEEVRLLTLRYGHLDPRLSSRGVSLLACLSVNVGSNPETNDLVSSLAAELIPDPTKKPVVSRQVIFDASESISFQLVRDATPPSYDPTVGRRSERATFKYPLSIYLDQFMEKSYELADRKRAAQLTLLQKVKDLEAKKKAILYFESKDTLADLQSCLYYYENVAESDGDPKRADEIRENKEKLRHAIDKIKEEVHNIDVSVERMRDEARGMLDCPELQKHRYDLRAVIVHDGFFGRSHLYSYVKYKGKWWKTVDYLVTEVSEDTVLNDPTGLHLGAGPYILIYSRPLSQEKENARAPWPHHVKDSVKHNNRMFFAQLPPEVASRVEDPNSPPSSPPLAPTPSEHTIESDIVEPPESRDEPMDLTV